MSKKSLNSIFYTDKKKSKNVKKKVVALHVKNGWKECCIAFLVFQMKYVKKVQKKFI